MPMYQYVARDRQGNPYRGEVSAHDVVEARKLLRGRELFVVELREHGARGLLTHIWRVLAGRG